MGFFTTERKLAVFDIENFRNYFLAQFKAPASGKVVGYDMWPGGHELDLDGLRAILKNYRIITFNGNNYDIPIITLALTGASNNDLKEASDEIIQKRMKPWEFFDAHRLKAPDYLDHIDLYEPAPGVRIGLKKYGARMHSKTVQDLPLHHDAIVKPHQRPLIRSYCENDLNTTWELYQALKGEIEMRERMSDQYGIDLRSKSDAQVAEAIQKNLVQKRTGRKLWQEEKERKVRIASGEEQPIARVFNYKAPDFIKFEDDELCDLVREIETAAFRIDRDSGKVIMPAFLENRIITIGDVNLKMGIGGIHSTESKQIVESDDEFILCDRDVTSYYPYLILICAMFPPKIGEIFLEIYRMIVEERVEAKRKGAEAEAALNEVEAKYWKIIADSFKILANGTFGKLGSIYSILYAPHLLIQVTITGQLSIMMLIADAFKRGIRAKSANTDGVVFMVPRARKGEFNSLVLDWEWQTGLSTEEVQYKALYSRDVNNYLAITTKGKVKGKGIFTKTGLRKDPQHWICYQAVIDFLKDNKSLTETIYNATDIRDFVQVRAAGDGGGVYDGKYLGTIVRWYMSTESVGPITLQETGNKVAGTDGCKPCMTLPDEIPDDLDRVWYLQEAHAVLDDLGYEDRPLNLSGRTGIVLGRLPGLKNVHRVDLSTMIAACGTMPKSRREPWVELNEVPEGHKFCARCRKEESL
ncbi:hypothetical protein AXY1_75 [Achromobacter phage AXY1]|nr:hypothetical protein AXY1_75 [Achromobacter phage AXY1]